MTMNLPTLQIGAYFEYVNKLQKHFPCGYYWHMSAVSGKCMCIMHSCNQLVDSMGLSLNLILADSKAAEDACVLCVCTTNLLVVQGWV